MNRKTPLPLQEGECFIARPHLSMKPYRQRRAFTLIEIVVVLGIIVLFLALLIPVVLRWRQGGNSAFCVKNMRLIGKAVAAYTAEHDEQLPGPLSQDQYTVDAAGNPPRDGQLLKYISHYLQQPSNSLDGSGGAKVIFTFPAWENGEHATDAPVFLVNIQDLPAFSQPAWGKGEKQPLKLSQLKEWTRIIGDKQFPVEPSKMWALTEADQVLTKLLGINERNEKWVQRMPSKALHMDHRNALYFDWHVESLILNQTAEKVLEL